MSTVAGSRGDSNAGGPRCWLVEAAAGRRGVACSRKAGVLKSVRIGGAVAALGMAGGVELATTVHPFILRGVTLAGIDAATQATPDDRRALWPRLAALWPRVREHFPVTELGLGDVGGWAERMLRGETSGRAVVVP